MKKSTQNKIVKTLRIIVIPLLLIAIGLIGYEVIMGQIEGVVRNILISITLLWMLGFCFILLRGIIKYKDEFFIDDYEKRRKWKTLSPEYKKFHKNFDIFALILYSVLILFGLNEILLYKNWAGLNSLIIGIGLGFVYLKQRKNLK